jgi:two-component system, chemotaxis family, protein-glutamate methylesterase/glutaminase
MMIKPLQAVVIGGSAGSWAALDQILPALPANYPMAIIVVLHFHPHQAGTLATLKQNACLLKIQEAQEKEPIQPGVIYIAPPNYHLLIEDDHTFSLSIDPKVNFTRPSIDVLFESAAHAYGRSLVGVILSGSNHDGAHGAQVIHMNGGIVIVQTPSSAEATAMPLATLKGTETEAVLSPGEIGFYLADLGTHHNQEEK